MKNKLLLLLSLLAFAVAQATIRYVNNQAPYPTGANHYTSLQTAINASTSPSYDSIYLQGSNLSYGNCNIPEGCYVRIFGAGHNPTTSPAMASVIGDIDIQETTEIIGVTINKVVNNIDANSVEILTLRRCVIVDRIERPICSGCPYSEVVCYGCIFQSTTANVSWNSNGALDRYYNCVFNGQVLGGANNAFWVHQFFNCIFLGTGSGDAFSTSGPVQASNTIFYGRSPRGYNSTTSGSGSIITSCMSFQCANNVFLNNDGANGNLTGIDPQFVTNIGAGAPYSHATNYQLQITSPGHNTGTDGTDRGLWGGTGGHFTKDGEPPLPILQQATVNNPVVNVGESLNVDLFIVRKK